MGHSMGGLLLGMAQHNTQVVAALNIASQHGYWRHWRGTPLYGYMFLLYHLFIPVSNRLLGYFAASRFGIGIDIPRTAADTWARAGRDPQFLLPVVQAAGVDCYQQLRIPMLFVGFEDDNAAPSAAIEALLPMYASAQSEHRHIVPDTLGLPPVGHSWFLPIEVP